MTPGDPEGILQRHFGLTSFRPGQRRVIAAILAGRSTLAVMPTGQGKSLCYQLPALMLQGVTVVVSPLIALMKDQVDSLRARGIAAAYINSSLSFDEQSQRLAALQDGTLRLIYVAPERFRHAAFLNALKGVRVGLFAVDEAHCLSQWGHDFRPDYLRLGTYVAACGNPVVLATTATATPEVRDDIVTQLGLVNPEVVVSGFSRPNLKWVVRYTPTEDTKMAKLREVLEKVPGSAVVYAATRKKVMTLSAALRQQGIEAVPYHAGMDERERALCQERFMSGSARVVVATNAFGMGIDKADVRSVIHVDLPGTLEAYYQEAGRAGRDGQLAFCVLLFSPADRYLQEFFIDGGSPSGQIIREVYDVLKRSASSPIFVSHDDLAAQLRRKTHPMAVGSALTLLERHGLIERQARGMTPAFLQLRVWGASAPRSAVQQRVIEHCRTIPQIASGVAIDLNQWCETLNLSRDTLIQTLQALHQKNVISYVSPARARGITVLRRVSDPLATMDTTFLESKRARELARLERVVAFAYSGRCRQTVILAYFGEVTKQPCGRCDHCQKRVDPGLAKLPALGATQRNDAPSVDHQPPLTRLRAVLARDAGLEDSTIVSDEVLANLINAAPRTLDELRRIRGMDEETLRRFGDQLLGGLVATQELLTRNERNTMSVPLQESRRVARRRERVAHFFRQGYDLTLIANRLMTDPAIIEQDLALLSRDGAIVLLTGKDSKHADFKLTTGSASSENAPRQA